VRFVFRIDNVLALSKRSVPGVAPHILPTNDNFKVYPTVRALSGEGMKTTPQWSRHGIPSAWPSRGRESLLVEMIAGLL